MRRRDFGRAQCLCTNPHWSGFSPSRDACQNPTRFIVYWSDSYARLNITWCTMDPFKWHITLKLKRLPWCLLHWNPPHSWIRNPLLPGHEITNPSPSSRIIPAACEMGRPSSLLEVTWSGYEAVEIRPSPIHLVPFTSTLGRSTKSSTKPMVSPPGMRFKPARSCTSWAANIDIEVMWKCQAKDFWFWSIKSCWVEGHGLFFIRC